MMRTGEFVTFTCRYNRIPLRLCFCVLFKRDMLIHCVVNSVTSTMERKNVDELFMQLTKRELSFSIIAIH